MPVRIVVDETLKTGLPKPELTAAQILVLQYVKSLPDDRRTEVERVFPTSDDLFKKVKSARDLQKLLKLLPPGIKRKPTPKAVVVVPKSKAKLRLK